MATRASIRIATLAEPVVAWQAELVDSLPPSAETQAGQRRLRAYRLALGEFVEVFVRAEIFMHFVLRWFGGFAIHDLCEARTTGSD
jgi:hypothetical protein